MPERLCDICGDLVLLSQFYVRIHDHGGQLDDFICRQCWARICYGAGSWFRCGCAPAESIEGLSMQQLLEDLRR